MEPRSLAYMAKRSVSLTSVYRTRALSTNAGPSRIPTLRRAMLYVPGSNPRMLEKSLLSPVDSVCYDLEDAVAPGSKVKARRAVCELLDVSAFLVVSRGDYLGGNTSPEIRVC